MQAGTGHAVVPFMAVRSYRDLIAWQLASQFQKEVLRLLQASPEAWRNNKFRDQLIDAVNSVVANLAEGFRRFSPGEFCKFIDYSLASLGEAEVRLEGGIDVGYFSAEHCALAFQLARRCLTASIRLKQSQSRFTRARKPRRSRIPPP